MMLPLAATALRIQVTFSTFQPGTTVARALIYGLGPLDVPGWCKAEWAQP